MPSILGRSNTYHGSKSISSRSSSSYPVLTSPALKDASQKRSTRRDFHRTESLPEKNTQSSLIFQLLTLADDFGTSHDSTYSSTDPSSSMSTSPNIDENNEVLSSRSLALDCNNRGRPQLRRSINSHINVRMNDDKNERTKKQSVSAPSFLEIFHSRQLIPPLTTVANDYSYSSSWGHYIDVTTATEDLDRKIDLYRQQRYTKDF